MISTTIYCICKYDLVEAEAEIVSRLRSSRGGKCLEAIEIHIKLSKLLVINIQPVQTRRNIKLCFIKKTDPTKRLLSFPNAYFDCNYDN